MAIGSQSALKGAAAMLWLIPATEVVQAVSGDPRAAMGHQGDARATEGQSAPRDAMGRQVDGRAMGGPSALRDVMDPQVHAMEVVQAASGGPHTAMGHQEDARAMGGRSAPRHAMGQGTKVGSHATASQRSASPSVAQCRPIPLQCSKPACPWQSASQASSKSKSAKCQPRR